MISNNIGQLAYACALQHACKHVYFAGEGRRGEERGESGMGGEEGSSKPAEER